MNKYVIFIINLVYIISLCLLYWIGDCQMDLIFLMAGSLIMLTIQGMLYLKK